MIGNNSRLPKHKKATKALAHNFDILKIKLTIIFVAFQFVLFSQNMPKGNWQIADVDVMGNIYLSDGQKLIKTSISGKEEANYKNSFYGDIKQIDCFKGLMILVYHKETSTIVMLDKNLAPIGKPLNLNDADIYNAEAVCLNDNNQVWIADMQTTQLVLLDKNMKPIAKGAIFGQYTSANEIMNMVFRNNQLVLHTSNNEILTFDRFGTFKGRNSFTEINHPFSINNFTFFISNHTLLRLNHQTQQIDSLGSTQNKNTLLVKSKNQLYLLDQNNIEPIIE